MSKTFIYHLSRKRPEYKHLRVQSGLQEWNKEYNNESQKQICKKQIFQVLLIVYLEISAANDFSLSKKLIAPLYKTRKHQNR